MTLSELLAALAAGVQVTIQDSDATVILKFTTIAGAAACFDATFLAREVDVMQLTGNAAATVKLKTV